MAEADTINTAPPPARFGAVPLSIGLALTALAGVGAAVVGGMAGAALAVVFGLLAQPALALAARGGRFVPREAGRDAWPVLALWALSLLSLSVLIAWPLSALLQGRTLGAAVAVSAVVGGALIGLWRTWPLWRWQEGEGGTLQEHWRALGDIDTRAWHGLGVALLLALPLAGILLLAWPDLMSSSMRWIVAGVCALAWPLAHRALLRMPSPSAVTADALLQEAIDEEEVEASALDAAAALSGADLDAALYDAARHGRAERALSLLDAGANRRNHRQPVALVHIGAVDRRQQLAEGPLGQLARFQCLLGTQACLEAGRRSQARRAHLHADGAAGVEHQEFLATHVRSPLF